MPVHGQGTGASASGSRLDQHQLGPPGGVRVLLAPGPGPPRGPRPRARPLRPGRWPCTGARARCRAPLPSGVACWATTAGAAGVVEPDGGEHLAVVALEPFSCGREPIGSGPERVGGRREGRPGSRPASRPSGRPKRATRTDPRHRGGEGQSGFQATSPGRRARSQPRGRGRLSVVVLIGLGLRPLEEVEDARRGRAPPRSGRRRPPRRPRRHRRVSRPLTTPPSWPGPARWRAAS